MQHIDQAYIDRLTHAINTLAEAMPEGDLNPKWLPRHLIYLEECTKTSLLDNIFRDVWHLPRVNDEALLFELLDRIQNKVNLLRTLAHKHQTLTHNTQHCNATFRAQQAAIYWVSRRGEKNLKLKLAKLKQALRNTQATLAQLTAHEARQVDVIKHLGQEGRLQQEIELLQQKYVDRIDPLRQPQTYCVRTNPTAYTTFQHKPFAQTTDQSTTRNNIQRLLKQLRDDA